MASCKNLLKKTPLIHEDTRLPEFANSLQKKISAALCAALASVIWTNFLFVDQEDSSTTPERNSFTKKFGTIQAAINAAEAGDVILINPGEYDEDLDLSNIVNRVTIQGAGIGETIVNSVDLTKAIGADPIQNITIKDISISGALNIDSTNVPTCFATGEVILQNTNIVGACTFTVLNKVVIIDCTISGASEINNCGTIDSRGSQYISDLQLNYDFVEITPSLGRGEYRFSECVFNDIDVRKQVVAYFDSECISDYIMNTEQIPLSSYGSGHSSEYPLITYRGKVTRVNVFYYDNPKFSVTPRLIGDFDHSEVDSEFIWKSASAEMFGYFAVTANNAVFKTELQGYISADGDVNGIANHCMMYLMNSTFAQIAIDMMTKPGTSGGVNRTLWTLDSMAIPVDGVPVTGFPRYINPSYTVHFELDGDEPSAQGTILVAAKTVEGYTATGSVGGIYAYTKLIQDSSRYNPT